MIHLPPVGRLVGDTTPARKRRRQWAEVRRPFKKAILRCALSYLRKFNLYGFLHVIACAIEVLRYDADDVLRNVTTYDEPWAELVRCARRIVIARHFHEFDPARADMLWKLRDSGAGDA